jgi:hypothetical protein
LARPPALLASVVALAALLLAPACSASDGAAPGGASAPAAAASGQPAPDDRAPDQLALADGTLDCTALGATAGADRCAAGPGTAGSSASTMAPTSTTTPEPAGAPSSTSSPFAAPSADPLVESLTQELVAASSRGTLTLSPTEARCVSSGMLSRLGPDVLAQLGSPSRPTGPFDVAALDPARRAAFADAVVACLDLRHLLIEQVGASIGLSNDDKECLADRMADDGTLAEAARQALVAGTDPTSSEQALTGPMLKALGACLSPEQLARLGRAH